MGRGASLFSLVATLIVSDIIACVTVSALGCTAKCRLGVSPCAKYQRSGSAVCFFSVCSHTFISEERKVPP